MEKRDPELFVDPRNNQIDLEDQEEMLPLTESKRSALRLAIARRSHSSTGIVNNNGYTADIDAQRKDKLIPALSVGTFINHLCVQ